MPDWWMRRDASAPRSITTVVLARPSDDVPDIKPSPGIPHDVVRLDPVEGVPGLARLAARAADERAPAAHPVARHAHRGRRLAARSHGALRALSGYGDGGRSPASERPHRRCRRVLRVRPRLRRARSRPAARGSGVPRPGVEAAFGQRGGIRPLRARLAFCRQRARHARAVGRVARSAGRVAGCRGASPGAARHLHAVPLRDARRRPQQPYSRRGTQGLRDRAWRSDARRPPLAAARRAHARPAVSFDGARV